MALSPVLVLLLNTAPAHAACPADTAALGADMAAAVQAYDDWDWEAFDLAVDMVREDLGCLSEVVSKADAQEIHQLFARVGARQGDADQAIIAFRGLLALDPDYEPDAALAQQGSLLRKAYDMATIAGAGAADELQPGAWFVDGRPGVREVPRERAALVQRLDDDGAFSSWYVMGKGLPNELTAYLAGAEAAPASPVEAAPEPVAKSEAPPPEPVPPAESPLTGTVDLAEGGAPSERARGGHASRGLLIGGVALAAVAVGGIGYAEYLQQEMMDIQKQSKAKSKYQMGLGISIGSCVLGTAGGGLVLVSVIKGQW